LLSGGGKGELLGMSDLEVVGVFIWHDDRLGRSFGFLISLALFAGN
jgi:hypothetical protein